MYRSSNSLTPLHSALEVFYFFSPMGHSSIFLRLVPFFLTVLVLIIVTSCLIICRTFTTTIKKEFPRYLLFMSDFLFLLNFFFARQARVISSSGFRNLTRRKNFYIPFLSFASSLTPHPFPDPTQGLHNSGKEVSAKSRLQ